MLKAERCSSRHLEALQDGTDANADVLHCHVLGLDIDVKKSPERRGKNDTHILDQSEGDKERETSSLPERQEHCNGL